jgi:futalosine hydrolase
MALGKDGEDRRGEPMPRAGPALLVVTAVEAEAEAVLAGLDRRAPTVAAVGVGQAAAAAGTARLLALAEATGRPYRAVICAGVAGGFAGRAEVGAIVLATNTIAADLGAQSPDGFLPLDRLGLGEPVRAADPRLFAALRVALPDALAGDVLTVNTVTGTAAGAAELAGRHPAALAEAMEGYGVACAAALGGVAFAELRTISNPVGPRDRAAWRLGTALTALTEAAEGLTTVGW